MDSNVEAVPEQGAEVVIAEAPPEITPTEVKIVLSEQQAKALEEVKQWFAGSTRKEFRLGGAAGTGKTTLIKQIVQELNVPTEVVSFTGKAVAVLRKKGLWQARTLHDLLYTFRFDGTRYIATPREYLFDCKLVIVDEASMVSTSLFNDLTRHDVKILWVGDPFQLEPVGENPEVLKRLDCLLTEIHRQAKLSPILRLATAVRGGMTEIPVGKWEREQSSLNVVRYLTELEDTYDVVVCGKNATRHRVNALRRKERNYDDILHEGETVVCLQNAKDMGVFNGMTFKVQKVHKSMLVRTNCIYTDLVDDTGREYPDVPIRTDFFGKDFKRDFQKEAIPFDYGYALTAHKCQGSEFDSVLVIDEPLYGSETNRWRYTAITRAAKHLTYVL